MADIFTTTNKKREEQAAPAPAATPTTNYQSAGFGKGFTPEQIRAQELRKAQLIREMAERDRQMGIK